MVNASACRLNGWGFEVRNNRSIQPQTVVRITTQLQYKIAHCSLIHRITAAENQARVIKIPKKTCNTSDLSEVKDKSQFQASKTPVVPINEVTPASKKRMVNTYTKKGRLDFN